MGEFRPGEPVLQSGIYRVYHKSHRLMHEATLRREDIFPCCRQCGRQVRFELVRPMQDQLTMSFRGGDILQEFPGITRAHTRAGRG